MLHGSRTTGVGRTAVVCPIVDKPPGLTIVGFIVLTVWLRPDTTDFQFRFLAECPALLSVTHYVSDECVMSLWPTFGFGQK